MTGGIGGGADVSSLFPESECGAGGLLIGWFVHGSRSTGFFSVSSGLGIGDGSGFSVGGCAVDGASGIFCGGWLGEDWPAIPGTTAHRHARASATTSQFAPLYLPFFLLSAADSRFTNTVRSSSIPFDFTQDPQRVACQKLQKNNLSHWDAWTRLFGASNSKD